MAAFPLVFLYLFMLGGYTAKELQWNSGSIRCSETVPCPDGFTCNIFAGDARGTCVLKINKVRVRRDVEPKVSAGDDNDFDDEPTDKNESYEYDDDLDSENRDETDTEFDEQRDSLESQDEQTSYDEDGEEDNMYVERLEKQLERDQKKHAKEEEEKESRGGEQEESRGGGPIEGLRNGRFKAPEDDVPVQDFYDTYSDDDDDDDDGPDYLDVTIYPELEKNSQQEHLHEQHKSKERDHSENDEGAAEKNFEKNTDDMTAKDSRLNENEDLAVEKRDIKRFPEPTVSDLPSLPIAHRDSKEEAPHPKPSAVNTQADSSATADLKDADTNRTKSSEPIPSQTPLAHQEDSKTTERPKSSEKVKPETPERRLTSQQIEILRGHLKRLRHPTGNNDYRQFSPETYQSIERVFFHSIRNEIEQIVGLGKLVNQPWFHAALDKFIDGEFNMHDLVIHAIQITSEDGYQLHSGSGQPPQLHSGSGQPPQLHSGSGQPPQLRSGSGQAPAESSVDGPDDNKPANRVRAAEPSPQFSGGLSSEALRHTRSQNFPSFPNKNEQAEFSDIDEVKVDDEKRDVKIVSHTKVSKPDPSKPHVVFRKIKESLNRKKSLTLQRTARDSPDTLHNLSDAKPSHRLSPRDLRRNLKKGVNRTPLSVKKHMSKPTESSQTASTQLPIASTSIPARCFQTTPIKVLKKIMGTDDEPIIDGTRNPCHEQPEINDDTPTDSDSTEDDEQIIDGIRKSSHSHHEQPEINDDTPTDSDSTEDDEPGTRKSSQNLDDAETENDGQITDDDMIGDKETETENDNAEPESREDEEMNDDAELNDDDMIGDEETETENDNAEPESDDDTTRGEMSKNGLESAIRIAKDKLNNIMEEVKSALSSIQQAENGEEVSSRAKRFTDLDPSIQKAAIVSHLLNLDSKDWAELVKQQHIKLPSFSHNQKPSPDLTHDATKYNSTTAVSGFKQENSTSSNSSSRTTRATHSHHHGAASSSHKHKPVKPSKNILNAYHLDKLRQKRLKTMHRMKRSSETQHSQHRTRTHHLTSSHHQHLPSSSRHHSNTTAPHHKKSKSPYHPRKLVVEDPEKYQEFNEDQDVEESPCKTKKGENLRHGERLKVDCNTCQCLYGKVECTRVDCTMIEPNVQETGLIRSRRNSTGRDDVVDDPCRRCEEKKDEAVCGKNRKTYNSLCYAVNCAGLQVDDVTEVSCERTDPCKGNTCDKKHEICIETPGGPCLSLYNSKNQKVKCARYICVPKTNCPSDNSHSSVCGEDEQTYQSLCHLQKAGRKLAYTGSCRPKQCSGHVCGSDGVTYSSPCHARSRSVRIDYFGKCFAEDAETDLGNCDDVRDAGRCSRLSCKEAVIPEGSCCPVCGAAVSIRPDSKGLADVEVANHMLAIENFIYKLLPETIHRACRISASLTDKGDISVVFEALSDKHISRCVTSAKDLVSVINKPPEMLRETSIITKLVGATQIQTLARSVMKKVSTASEKYKTDAKSKGSPEDIDFLGRSFNNPSINSSYVSGAVSRSMKALSVVVVTVSVTISLGIAMSMT